jgi:nitrogen fixation protein FixH
MKTENRGGVRTSLTKKIGRPTKEPTRVLNFRVPVKEYDRLKVLLREYLDSLLNGA